jgi:hypothetical protein
LLGGAEVLGGDGEARPASSMALPGRVHQLGQEGIARRCRALP